MSHFPRYSLRKVIGCFSRKNKAIARPNPNTVLLNSSSEKYSLSGLNTPHCWGQNASLANILCEKILGEIVSGRFGTEKEMSPIFLRIFQKLNRRVRVVQLQAKNQSLRIPGLSQQRHRKMRESDIHDPVATEQKQSENGAAPAYSGILRHGVKIKAESNRYLSIQN